MKAINILGKNFKKLISTIKEFNEKMGRGRQYFFLEVIVVFESDLSIGVIYFRVLNKVLDVKQGLWCGQLLTNYLLNSGVDASSRTSEIWNPCTDAYASSGHYANSAVYSCLKAIDQLRVVHY